MSKKIARAEIIDQVAVRTGLHRSMVKEVLKGMLDVMSAALLAGESIELRSLGTFNVVCTSQREKYVPKTGEKVLVPSRRLVKFKMSGSLKNKMNE